MLCIPQVPEPWLGVRREWRNNLYTDIETLGWGGLGSQSKKPQHTRRSEWLLQAVVQGGRVITSSWTRMGVIIYRQTKRQDYYIQMNKEAGLANLNTSDLCRLCRGGSLLALSIGVSKLRQTFFFCRHCNICTQTQGRLWPSSECHPGKALLLLWDWGFGVLDVAVTMSTIRIHSIHTTLIRVEIKPSKACLW